jgi:hypothetical protein
LNHPEALSQDRDAVQAIRPGEPLLKQLIERFSAASCNFRAVSNTLFRAPGGAAWLGNDPCQRSEIEATSYGIRILLSDQTSAVQVPVDLDEKGVYLDPHTHKSAGSYQPILHIEAGTKKYRVDIQDLFFHPVGDIRSERASDLSELFEKVKENPLSPVTRTKLSRLGIDPNAGGGVILDLLIQLNAKNGPKISWGEEGTPSQFLDQHTDSFPFSKPLLDVESSACVRALAPGTCSVSDVVSLTGQFGSVQSLGASLNGVCVPGRARPGLK